MECDECAVCLLFRPVNCRANNIKEVLTGFRDLCAFNASEVSVSLPQQSDSCMNPGLKIISSESIIASIIRSLRHKKKNKLIKAEFNCTSSLMAFD